MIYLDFFDWLFKRRSWWPLMALTFVWAASYLVPFLHYRVSPGDDRCIVGSFSGAIVYCSVMESDHMGIRWSTFIVPELFGIRLNDLYRLNLEFDLARSGRSSSWGRGAKSGWRFFGFVNEEGYTGEFGARGPVTFSRVALPYWFLAALAAIRPAFQLRRERISEQRRKHGFCAQCGYDLRASPDKCPECAAVPEDAAE